MDFKYFCQMTVIWSLKKDSLLLINDYLVSFLYIVTLTCSFLHPLNVCSTAVFGLYSQKSLLW